MTIDPNQKNWWTNEKLPNPGFNGHGHAWSNWCETLLIKNAIINNETIYNFEEFVIFENKETIGKFVNDNNGRELMRYYSDVDNDAGYNLGLSGSGSLYIWPDSMLQYWGNESTIKFISSNQELMDKFRTFIKAETIPQHKTKNIYVMVNGSDGPYLTSAGTADLKFERDNYEDGIVQDFDYIVKELNAKTPYGRLVVLNGPPGTGKTFFVRALLHELQNSIFVLIQPDMLAALMGPQLIQPILNLQPPQLPGGKTERSSIVLILEDADKCLVPRLHDNMTEITSLLNFGDGILGTLFDVRVIATTNARKMEVDDALMRAGRLCRMSEISLLSPSTANRIFKRLTDTEGSFTKKVSLGDVYQLAHQSDWKSAHLNDSMGYKEDNKW